MTATRTSARSEATIERLESFNPATGNVIGTVPVLEKPDVDAAVIAARDAFGTWGELSHSDRRERLLTWRRELAGRVEEIADLIHLENGKTTNEATQEVFGALGHLTYAATRAEKALRPHKMPTGVMANFRATVSYFPFGVIGVIGPWNYPILTPMGSIAFALAAGNTVVFKPSELTPLVGKAFCESADAAFGVPNVLQVVTGDGRTGAALASADVDKIAFTGSTATGRRVMAAAAEKPIPVVMELGGNDAMIVAADADVDKAAQSAVYGGLTNTGQACVSIERVYVVDSVYDRFLDKVVEEADRVKSGDADDADVGVMTDDRQIGKVRDHIEDALSRGAKAVVGGLDTFRDRNVIEPTVLVNVTDEMKVMSEETFGPVLPIVRVANADEAIRAANSTPYGLGSSVWGRAGIRALADRVRAGMTAVNSVMTFSVISALPFGGVGESGFGRIHGDEGLKEFSRAKATAEEKFPLPFGALAFPDDPDAMAKQMRGLVKALFGGGVLDKAESALRKLRR